MKLHLVFEKYPQIYQPYIPLLIAEIAKQEDIDLSITSLIKQSKSKLSINSILDNVTIKHLPSPKIQQVLGKFYGVRSRFKHLNYFEIVLLKNNYDIIHIQHSFLFPHVLNLLDISSELRPKIVITLRGGDTYIKPWILKRWSNFYKHVSHKVDAFITVSEHQKDYLKKWGVLSSKIFVVPVSFGHKTNVINQKTSNKQALKIVSSFRMTWEKNIEGNLRVIKGLVEKAVPVEYHIFGDGNDLGQVYFLIDKFGIGDKVKVWGQIDNVRYKAMLSNYDIYLQLSISEALSASVLEAQACGLPCIVSDSSGILESIIDQKTGIAVAYNQPELATIAIMKLWQSPELYSTYSSNAIKFANESFSTSSEVRKLINVYSQVLNCNLPN